MFLLSKKIIHEIYRLKTCMEKCLLSWEFRLKLRKVNYWKSQQNFWLSPKKFIYEYFIYIFIYSEYFVYIFSVGGKRGCCGWLGRDKENEETRNPSLYACRFSHHIYMPVKQETCNGLLPNKNHAWNIF